MDGDRMISDHENGLDSKLITRGYEPIPVNGRPLVPRRDTAARHIKLLTGSARTYCHFRLVRKAGEGWNMSGTLADLWPDIDDRQRDGWQVYIVVNEGGHNTRSITCVRALFVDGDGVPTPAVWHAEPDFIVRRDATHWHAYWLVAGMPKGNFKAAQKRLAASYGTDRKVCDLPRIMRLAGTLHLKDPARPFLVAIEADDHARGPRNARSAAELLSGLPEIIPAKRTAAALPTGEPVSLEILRAMLAHLDPSCDRNEWRDIIAAIRAAPVPGDDDESGRRDIAHEWSEGGYNYDSPEDVDRVFDDMEPPEPGDDDKIHFGSLVTRARAAGYSGAISIRGAEASERFRALAETPAASDFMARVIEASQGAIHTMPKPPERTPSPEFVEMAKRLVAEERRRGEDLARRWRLK